MRVKFHVQLVGYVAKSVCSEYNIVVHINAKTPEKTVQLFPPMLVLASVL